MGITRIRTGRAWAGALAVALAWSGAGLASAQTPAPVAAQHDAATQRRNDQTEGANRAAAVADEASATQAHPAAGTAAPAAADTRTSPTRMSPTRMSPTRMSPAGLSYGPVLTPRNGSDAQNGHAVRKDPAEVSDETDTLARQAAPAATQPQPSNPQLTDKQRDEQRRRAARRRPAYQGERPMAPRPLRSSESPPAFVAEPVPAPLPAPQPVVPTSNAVRGCQGIACTDAAGNTFNGSGNAGVGSGGRMCARTGATVQCF